MTVFLLTELVVAKVPFLLFLLDGSLNLTCIAVDDVDESHPRGEITGSISLMNPW